MELETCLKAVVSSVKQYRCRSDENAISCILRHLDVLIGIITKESQLNFGSGGSRDFFNECLSSLIDVLNDVHITSMLAKKILTVLNYSVNKFSASHATMCSSFNALETLLEYFKLCSSSPHDLNMLLCIKILQKITYKHHIAVSLSKVEGLLNYLLNTLENAESDATKHCLGLLANLTFKTQAIQCFIKSKENSKSILKKLMGYISNTNYKIQVFAISALCNLCLYDDIGDKIFRGQNLLHMFHFLFNVLHVTKFSSTIQSYAVDIFVNILSCEKICDQLADYAHLPRCLHILTSSIQTPVLHNYKVILELLLAFSSVPKLRIHIYRIECSHSACQESLNSILEQGAVCFFSSLVTLILKEEKDYSTFSILCLNLIGALYSEPQDQTMYLRKERLDILKGALTRILAYAPPTHDCNRSPKLLKAFQLLKRLSGMKEVLDAKICVGVIKMHLNCFNDILHDASHEANSKDGSTLSQFHKNDDDSLKEIPCLELVFELVEFLEQFHHNKVQEITEDSGFTPFIVRGLSSISETCILKTLKIILAWPDRVNVSVLAHSMNRINQYKLKSSPCDHSERAVFGSDTNGILSSLVERVRINPEVKDLKVSEIISIYELKLQDMQAKENMIQNLLDVKGEALSQSEKILSQVKLRLAQHEAEAQGLRLMVLNSEKQKEDLSDVVDKQSCELNSLQKECKALSCKNMRLSEVEKNFKSMTASHSAVTQKLEFCQQSLENLEQDHRALLQMEGMLRKRNEELKANLELHVSKLALAEDEKLQLTTDIEKKELRILELSRMLACSEDSLKKKAQECGDMESSVKKLQSELSRSMQINKDLHHQISSLEISITEKNASIQRQKNELDNYEKATALFCSLIPGNAKPGLDS